MEKSFFYLFFHFWSQPLLFDLITGPIRFIYLFFWLELANNGKLPVTSFHIESKNDMNNVLYNAFALHTNNKVFHYIIELKVYFDFSFLFLSSGPLLYANKQCCEIENVTIAVAVMAAH